MIWGVVLILVYFPFFKEDVFEKTTKFLIKNVINGFNATVFAYGATGELLF